MLHRKFNSGAKWQVVTYGLMFPAAVTNSGNYHSTVITTVILHGAEIELYHWHLSNTPTNAHI